MKQQTKTAQLTLVPAALGDADGDGDVDLLDYDALLDCWPGPGSSAPTDCRAIFDFSSEGTVDLEDFAGFQGAFTGEIEGLPDPTVVLDTDLKPLFSELPGFDGTTPRPVACLTDESGYQAEFVENEVVLITETPSQLNDFLDRWGGVELLRHEPTEDELQGLHYHLIRIKTDSVPTATLAADLKRLEPQARGKLRVSSRTGMRLLAAAAREAVRGSRVGVNWVGRPDGYRDRTTTDAPTGPDGYSTNAFEWLFLNAGSTQDIGVTEAWWALDLAGKLDNKVKIAVLDMGFDPDDDFPGRQTYISNVPFIFDPRGEENLLGCGGGDCPWHGTNVVGAAMGVPDNSFGAAGPAGPVAEAVMVFTLYDFFTGITAVAQARAVGARIINMSYHARVPASLSWSVIPFDLATRAAHNSGALLFAAAGNEGANVDAEDCFIFCWEEAWYTPCENGGVTCVGGLQWDSQDKASGSNYGGEEVDIYAPYTVWVGPDPDDGGSNLAQSINGTSFSSPYTAGVAALVWAADPSLSANQVMGIINSTAHSSPDGRVKRYVNAYEAVISALGSEPPFLRITSPADGQTISRNVPVHFFADASDREDGVPNVVWTSSRQTPSQIGTGTYFSRNDLTLGTHTIRATTTDSSGIEVVDTATITVVNDPPRVEIIEPLDHSEFCVGEAVVLRASSFDRNNRPTYQLPGSDMRWTSNRQGLITTGHESVAFLVADGAHTITLQGTDDQGEIATETITVTLEPQPCEALTVVITQPATDTDPREPLYYDGYDGIKGLWYKDVVFRGQAFDPGDGLLTGASLVWRTDQTDIQPAELGTGGDITVRLYGKLCTGVWHEITLTATDSEGNSRARVRRIFIHTLC